jgi:RNA polymerase sigma-70 factor (ECF subfamily)
MEDFEALYQQHLPGVFRYALRCVGRRDIAEEIVADAFLALYRNRDRIDVAQLPGWLLTVVRNRSVDYWRRVQLEQRNAMALEKTATDPAAQREEALDAWLVEQCKDLKPAHRACLLLRFAHGMTRAEIARELGLTENQVKGALQYALELLRKAFPESPLRRESKQ